MVRSQSLRNSRGTSLVVEGLYGIDVGWNRTAAIWGAWDKESDTIYCYSEHYRGQAEPPVHTDAIKVRGDWMVGAIDPASRGR